MIHYNVIYQDNQSAIRLEKNGKQSSSKMARLINIKYYFITDGIINQEASVEFCPTFDMIGEYFTKSLQGSQLCRYRNIVLGIHKYEITAYNASRRDFLEKRKLKPKREKEEAQKSAKLSGD